ncbi:MAG: hypothetical protein U1A78_42125 [Polyangia bacterium]
MSIGRACIFLALLPLCGACSRGGMESVADLGTEPAYPDLRSDPGDLSGSDLSPPDLTPPDPPPGTVLYVIKGGRGKQDGTSPKDAMPTIGMALQKAQLPPNPAVWVAAGTYSETLSVLPPQTLLGGFDETFRTRDPQRQPTVVQADADNVLHVDGRLTGVALVDGLSFISRRPASTTNQQAVYVYPGAGRLQLVRCRIDSSGGYSNYCIRADGGNVLADGNVCNASGGTIANYLFYGYGTFLNNVAFASDGVTSTSGSVLVNNTLRCSGYDCLRFVYGGGTIANNILIGTSRTVAINASSTADVARIENNVLFGFGSLYFGKTAGEVKSLSTLNSAAALGVAAAGGNVIVDPALDTELVPTANTPASVLAGGLDASSALYGGVRSDRDNHPRALPYSIGAYQRP